MSHLRSITRSIKHFKKMKSAEFPIDIVYTWVNGDDPNWVTKKNSALQKIRPGELKPTAHSASRFTSVDELKYSLRSIHAFAPWIRTIHIVTDEQIPKWLNTEHPQIRVVDHKEIFKDATALPTFNSTAIEANLHNIPELSEHFIYFNDDVFIGKSTKPTDFFTKSGLPYIFTKSILQKRKSWHTNRNLKPEKLDEVHFNHVLNARLAVQKQTGKLLHHELRHVAVPFKRSILQELANHTYKYLFATTTQAKFRTTECIAPSYIFSLDCIANRRGKAKHLTTPKKASRLKTIIYKATNADYGQYIRTNDKSLSTKLNDLKVTRPLLFCLNDSHDTPPENKAEMIRFLESFYPTPSPFEI